MSWARTGLGLLGAGLLLGALAGCDFEPPAGDAPPGRPNVIVVMTDDQDVASMAAMPTVQRELVDRGTSFESSYVALSECCPSRATFLTGQHAHNHGVKGSRPPGGGYSKLDSTNTLAVWLSEAGYATAQIGRYLNFYGNSKAGNDPKEVPPGWDDWHVPVEHTEFQLFDYLLNENGTLRRYGNEPSDYQTDVLSRKTTSFIRRSAREEEPFFVWLTPTAPHSEGVLDDVDAPRRNPRPAPRDDGAFEDVAVPTPPSFAEPDDADKPDFIRRRRRLEPGAQPGAELTGIYRGRMESLLAVDRMVGRVMEELRRTGELDDTYVVFTSDNGFLTGEHGQVGKHLVYEESTRVPLVIRGPGVGEGVVVKTPVQNIDLAPTIADIAGAEAGLEPDGISLVPALEGSPGPDRDLLIEYLESRVSFAAVRSADGLVYVDYDDGSKELYDLGADPFQLRNLAGDPRHASDQERLANRLESLRDCAGSSCR